MQVAGVGRLDRGHLRWLLPKEPAPCRWLGSALQVARWPAGAPTYETCSLPAGDWNRPARSRTSPSPIPRSLTPDCPAPAKMFYFEPVHDDRHHGMYGTHTSQARKQKGGACLVDSSLFINRRATHTSHTAFACNNRTQPASSNVRPCMACRSVLHH